MGQQMNEYFSNVLLSIHELGLTLSVQTQSLHQMCKHQNLLKKKRNDVVEAHATVANFLSTYFEHFS